jgi:hypothetical protein
VYEVDVDSSRNIRVEGRVLSNNDCNELTKEKALKGKLAQPNCNDLYKSMIGNILCDPKSGAIETPKNVWAIPYFKRPQYDVQVNKGRMLH